MKTTPIALAYCIDNLPIAEAIEKNLSSSSIAITHHYCKKTSSGISVGEQLQDHDGPILLLVSDNFLKSLNCMDKSLKFIQAKNNQILPVVVDGRRYDEKTGTYSTQQTKFEKIGDIIPYINYWQNQYLDLRSQRKSIESEQDFDKEAFGEHLRVLRQVSSEASEFLRVLRNMPHYPYAAFAENHYEVLFDFLDLDEDWEAFKANNPNMDHLSEDSLSSIVEDDFSEEEMDIGEIPGIELLEGSENIARIIKNKLNDPTEENEEDEIQEESEPSLEELNEEIELLVSQGADPDPVDPNLEEEEEYEEEDIFEGLLVDEEGEPAGSEEYVQDEHSEDSIPAPEEFVPQSPIIEFMEESDGDAPESSPFDDLDEFFAEKEPHLDEVFEEEVQSNLETDQIPEASDILPVEEEEFITFSKAEALLDQAFELLNAGQIEDGITYLEQATKKYPSNSDLKYHFALMLAQNTSNFPKAIEQLEDLLQQKPDHIEANFLMGELAELDEDYNSAHHYYRIVESESPGFKDIYYRLGVVALHLDDPKLSKARKYFKKAIKQNSKHVDAHYQYALLSNELKGDQKKAIKFLKKTIKLAPKHPFANYDLALLFFQLEEAVEANFYYQKAIEINPELHTVENDRAFDLSPTETHFQTTSSIVDQIEKDPDFKEVMHLEGLEADALEALKENIHKLEELLLGKEQPKVETPKTGKTIFITGASSGIGRASAIKFAEHGYRLILNGRRAKRLEKLAKNLSEKYNSDILVLPFDVSDNNAVEEAISGLDANWSTIDILLNNAGKAKGFTPIHEGELVHWEEMIDVNLKGLLYLTRVVSPKMVAAKSGHIINICSTAGHEVYPNGNVYCATKHAVDALTKSMRIDLHKFDIKVSQVSPGHVEETEFAEVRFDGDKDRAKIYQDFLPLTSGNVADTIYYIATQPAHVNIQDVLMMGTQQASSNFINRSGRNAFSEEE